MYHCLLHQSQMNHLYLRVQIVRTLRLNPHFHHLLLHPKTISQYRSPKL
jgi:hypothetical protein